jgi:hypothetical protein
LRGNGISSSASAKSQSLRKAGAALMGMVMGMLVVVVDGALMVAFHD